MIDGEWSDLHQLIFGRLLKHRAYLQLSSRPPISHTYTSTSRLPPSTSTLISTQRTHNRHPAMSGPARTSIELYRDLLRLISHIAPGTSPKSIALRTMIRSEFNKSRLLSPDSPADAVKIEALKANAVRALSNYMLYEGGIQDKRKGGKLGAAMDTYHERSLEGIQQNKKDERRRPGGNNKTET